MAIESMIGNDNLHKKIIEWGYNYLSSHGYSLQSAVPENVQNTPWSYVVRFATSDAYIYLKQTPTLLALEPIITNILHDQFHASVPVIIAHNTKLKCFLMKDAGGLLRTILKKQFNAALLCNAIEKFTAIQLEVSDHANIFLDIGVPDWRLDKLTDLFKQLLLQRDVLIADGLSAIEIDKLVILLPTVSNLCNQLSNYSIKQTIVQCDFHDNNILIDEISQNITFIDLGEIVISHPFFSLIGCLRQAIIHHALKDGDDTHMQLKEACLKNFIPFEPKDHLVEAFAIARRLWYVYEALAQYRLRLACDKARFLTYQTHGKLSGRLREFIAFAITQSDNA